MKTNKIISPITYYGAKSNNVLSDWIISHFPEHHTYVDVFGGSGIILLRKTPAKVEVYNDIDLSLVNLFDALRFKRCAEYLEIACKNTPYSRADFRESKHLTENDMLENARRAMVRFNMSFAGNGHFFSTSVKASIKGIPATVRRFQRRVNALQAAHERLKNIIVENEDFRKIIPRYDTPETLFYLDPPYALETRDGKNRYIHEFKKKDHKDLIEIISSLRGAVVISGYACEAYSILEKSGFIRHDKEVILKSSIYRTKKTESIWVKTNAKY